MAEGNNPTETSYQEYKENKLKEAQAKKDHEPSTTDKGTAAKKLKERRKKFKFKLPKVEGLDEDQSEDVASAMSVFAGGAGGSTGDSTVSPSGGPFSKASSILCCLAASSISASVLASSLSKPVGCSAGPSTPGVNPSDGEGGRGGAWSRSTNFIPPMLYSFLYVFFS